MEHVVTSCGDCPMRDHDFKGDSFCNYPSEHVPSTEWNTLPKLCPLRTEPLTLKIEPMGMGTAARGAGT